MKISFEKVLADSGSSFAVREKKERGFQGNYHFHPEFEITQILSGSGVRLIGDDLSPFEAGDLVLIGSNLPHRYTSDPQSAGWSEARVVQFSESHLGGGILQAPECQAISRLLERASRGIWFRDTPAADRHLGKILKIKGFPRLQILLTLLDELSTSTGASPISSAGYIPSISTFESDKVNRALNFIQRHMQDPLTMPAMAAHLKVSPATCNRLFHKSLGRSFKAFLLEVRVGHACKLLLETDAPVISIAGDCGFSNLSNFNRQFKARKNLTPREFRAQGTKSGAGN